MAVQNRTIIAKPKSEQIDSAVVAFLKELEHPLKTVVESVRQLILGTSPRICEGIKWNSPSFRTTDYFATLNLRGAKLRLILHTGAKVKDNSVTGTPIADPAGLLEWLAKDRCQVTLADEKEFRAKQRALQAIIREWIQLPELNEAPPVTAKPRSIDEYLAKLNADQRATLERLRKTIHLAAPKAEECISYGIAAFRLNGMLVGFGATAKHCAFYLMSSSMLETFRKDLEGYETSQGTIRFSPDQPLPATLVRQLVKARIVENAGKSR